MPCSARNGKLLQRSISTYATNPTSIKAQDYLATSNPQQLRHYFNNDSNLYSAQIDGCEISVFTKIPSKFSSHSLKTSHYETQKAQQIHLHRHRSSTTIVRLSSLRQELVEWGRQSNSVEVEDALRSSSREVEDVDLQGVTNEERTMRQISRYKNSATEVPKSDRGESMLRIVRHCTFAFTKYPSSLGSCFPQATSSVTRGGRPIPMQFFSFHWRMYSGRASKRATRPSDAISDEKDQSRRREPWQIQKDVLSNKFGHRGWLPKKRLSPDTLEGIRNLHAQYPDRYTTPVLADRFKVSPEAIRRILKSNWRPNDKEEEERRERWNKRGESIWTQMAGLGVKPPKKWRRKGVGRLSERIATGRYRARPLERTRTSSGPLPRLEPPLFDSTRHQAPLADRIS